ncbi:MAG TPA: hypothetical protein PLP42_05975 [Acidobacteriota bacterium]|nr:hypothetical protein [Acidobacteriota bacterium]
MPYLQMFARRLPDWFDVRLAFVACALVVYNWLVIQYLYRLPGWLYYQTAWDLVGILGYGLVSAAIESAFLLFILLALAVVLPPRVLRDKFAVGATGWVLVTGVWAAISQYNDAWLREAGLGRLAFVFVLYAVSVVIIWFVTYRFRTIQVHVRSFLERALTLLYFLYLPATLLGLILITLRNIG